MATVLYASPEDVKTAMDTRTNHADTYVFGRVASSSDVVEGTLRRRFYPEYATRTFHLHGTSGVWLEEHELVSVESVTLDGVAVDLSTVTLSRGPKAGDPITRIDLLITGELLAVTGIYGYQLDERTVTTVTAITSTTVTVTDVSAIGTGSLIRVGTERMLVTRRDWITSGNTTPVTLTAANNDNTFTTDATVHAGELLLVGAERMLVTDVAGSMVIVERAVDGTVLAAHTADPLVYAQRLLQADRAVLGTTQAAHAPGDAVLLFSYPSLVVELCLAQSLVGIQQGRSGYGRTVGAGDNAQEATGRGLADVRRDAIKAHGRPVRSVFA